MKFFKFGLMKKEGQILGKGFSVIPVMFIIIVIAAVFLVASVAIAGLKSPTESLTNSVSTSPAVYNKFLFGQVSVNFKSADKSADGAGGTDRKMLLFDAFLEDLNRIKYPNLMDAERNQLEFLGNYDSEFFDKENCFFAIAQLTPAQALNKNGIPTKGFGETDYFGDEEIDFYNSPAFYNKDKFSNFNSWEVFQKYVNAGKKVEYFDAYWDRNGKKDLLQFFVYDGGCLE